MHVAYVKHSIIINESSFACHHYSYSSFIDSVAALPTLSATIESHTHKLTLHSDADIPSSTTDTIIS